MTPVLQKKICMLGGFSVGKTSLVKRYVQSIFSEAYLTTVGVKIDKKTVDLSDRTVTSSFGTSLARTTSTRSA